VTIKKVKENFENQKLSFLRHWLLTMLMHGHASVGEVDEKLGMVANDKEECIKR
jgi:hypothetical protein